MMQAVLLFAVFLFAVAVSLLVGGRLTGVALNGREEPYARPWSTSDVPRIGGVAVFVGMSVAILVAIWVEARLAGKIPRIPGFSDALIAGAAVLFLVGLLDDIRGTPPLVKLVAQTLGAVIVHSAGFSIGHVTLVPGHVIELGVLSLPVTILWLVGMSNAFNLIDGMDGVAGGVAIISVLPVAAAALILGNGTVPVYTTALAGALVGFLWYNWPKARLFMGDSGSLAIGFILAVLSVKGATDKAHVIHGLVPIFALAYPLLDTGIAMLRRWLRGVPLSRADRRHIHHQLAAIGLSPRKSLLFIYALSASVGAIGLMAAFAPAEVTFLASMIGFASLITIVAVSVRWLQYHEFSAASGSVANAARKATSVIRDKINARDIATVIGQANNVEEVQAILEDSASLFRFAYMKLATPETRRRLPGRITQEMQALRLWKLEYPIAYGTADDYDGLCLTIWCSLEVAQQPAGAERIAQIIGPAILAWARSGKYKPAVPAYGDRLLHVEYSPYPVDVIADRPLVADRADADRALVASVVWKPVPEEVLSS